MNFYSRETKCLVEVLICSYFEKIVKKFIDPRSLFNICIVKVIGVEAYEGEFIKKGVYAFYIPEESYLKPEVDDKLWVSSRSLIRFFDLGLDKSGIIDACYYLLKITIWYLSWNPTFESFTSKFDIVNTSPFPVCIVSPNVLLGCLLGYPYFLKKIPVTILVSDRNGRVTPLGIRKEYLDLVKILIFADVSSTIEDVMCITQEFGFSNIIICPSHGIPEDNLLQFVLGSVSVNGTVVSFHKFEQLSNIECSILFQKRCNLVFSGPNTNPENWILKLLNEHYLYIKKTDLFDINTTENNLFKNDTIKVGNELAYVLAKSF